MYFALGFLASGLLALMIMPAIWRRAVRLTKQRIEAATPVTMAEFRADKDQLRAEFALSTRRLERNVEALRARLAEQVVDVSRRKSELAQAKAERDEKLTIIGELEDRESELRARILDLEKQGADVAQRLRMRDRDYANLSDQLGAVRGNGTLSNLPDIDQLYADLTAERDRANFFETQARHLLERLESAENDSSAAARAVAQLREALMRQTDETDESSLALTEAEARIASAENRLNALLHETEQTLEGEDERHAQLLAEKLSLEEEMAHLREKVRDVETAVLNEWDQERVDQSHLREKLNDIASEVSRLVYAVDGDTAPSAEESLFDKVRKFADDDFAEPELAEANGPVPVRRGSLSDRMAALREIQARQ
jgi:chromosome segregation ATPase